MTNSDIDNRVDPEMWVSGIVAVVGWIAWVLLTSRSTLGFALVGVAYVATFVLVRALRLRAAARRNAR